MSPRLLSVGCDSFPSSAMCFPLVRATQIFWHVCMLPFVFFFHTHTCCMHMHSHCTHAACTLHTCHTHVACSVCACCTHVSHMLHLCCATSVQLVVQVLLARCTHVALMLPACCMCAACMLSAHCTHVTCVSIVYVCATCTVITTALSSLLQLQYHRCSSSITAAAPVSPLRRQYHLCSPREVIISVVLVILTAALGRLSIISIVLLS